MKITSLLFRALFVLLLFGMAIPAQATLIGGHRHCKISSWSKVISITEDLDEPQLIRNSQTINPVPNPAAFIGNQYCEYELSDITKVTISGIFATSTPPNFMLLDLGIYLGSDDIQEGIIVSGGSFSFSLDPHDDFTFDTFQTTAPNLSFTAHDCDDAECKQTTTKNEGFSQLSISLEGHHYYVDEPSTLLITLFGVFSFFFISRVKKKLKA